VVVDRVRSWAATIVFLPVFALILLAFDVAQRLARLFGQRPQEYVAGALQMALVWAFRLCGTRLIVERAGGFAPGGRYIVVANHQSMFDIPILGSLLFSSFPKYISKRSLGRWIPSVSYNLRRGGHVLIERSDGPAALAAIREPGARVRTRPHSSTASTTRSRPPWRAVAQRRAGRASTHPPSRPLRPAESPSACNCLEHLPWRKCPLVCARSRRVRSHGVRFTPSM